MPQSPKRKGRRVLVYDKRNYMLLLGGLMLIVIGFAAMYLENQFLGVISLSVSPILILAGYGIIGYALLWQPEKDENQEPAEAS